MHSHSGGGSGGYLEHVFYHAAKILFNEDVKEFKYQRLRNDDFQELNLVVHGEVKLKFAFAYGFRNIQNIVQKLKKKACDYHYVEIMACPSGEYKGYLKGDLQNRT